jgi:type I restriction enzyme, S subunit
MRSSYKRIGDYIQQVKVKNTDGKYDLLLGINIDKHFMPSVANIVGTDLTKYKVVHYNQFACNRMHVGRDNRIPLALSQSHDPFIVSPAYTVFEITDTSELYPEYLMMWFSRAEFDREAWFHTDADVRGGLPWDLFCDIEFPVPSIEKQREIVKEYNTVVNRIKLNEQLNQKLEETAQAIYKRWFVDFEFPNENGRPYKSSGGKMVYNEELDHEVPELWGDIMLPDLLEVKYGKDYKHLNEGKIPLYGSGGVMKYVDNFLYDKPSILIPRKGTLSNIMYVDHPFWSVDTMFYSKLKDDRFAFYSFYYLKQLDFMALNVGSAVPSMTTEMLNSFKMGRPVDRVLEDFNSKLSVLHHYIKERIIQNQKLKDLASTVLSKISKIESLKTEQLT